MISDFQFKLSAHDINKLPLCKYQGPVELVDDDAGLQRTLAALGRESLIGFDTETRPAFKKGVSYQPSLVQLAGEQTVHLIRLGGLSSTEALFDLLSDPGVTKTGVAVRDDLLDLQRIAPFEPAGFVDLGKVAMKLQLETYGLRNLAAKFLGVRISKSAKCTNWDRKDLSRQQIDYAATDAWVSREIHLRFQKLQIL